MIIVIIEQSEPLLPFETWPEKLKLWWLEMFINSVTEEDCYRIIKQVTGAISEPSIEKEKLEYIRKIGAVPDDKEQFAMVSCMIKVYNKALRYIKKFK